MTPDPVRENAEARPDAPAVAGPETTSTWADLDARADAAAAGLVGVAEARPWSPRGLVAAVLPTTPGAVAVLLGALRAGVCLVPLSPRWPAAALADALARLGLTRLWTDGDAPPGVDARPLADLFRSGGTAPSEALDPARPFTVVHTSGTTGAPKAAVHTVGNHLASARGVNRAMSFGPGDRWLLDLPLAHVGGLGIVVRAALSGASVVIPAPGTPAAAALAGATHASLVSTQLFRLLRDAPDPPPGLRAVLLGGSAIPPGLLDAAHARGWPVATSYGLTEMTSTVTATPPGADRADLATSGPVLDGRTLRISDTSEILVGGPALFAGYVDGDRLRPPGDVFATGDLGTFDDADRLVVTGRIGHRFVSAGENVQPEAVEAALAALPGVAEAVVVPVADPEYGARPVAFVRPTGDALPPEADLRAGLRRTLPGIAIPVAFHAWDGPEGMKPDRRALAERLRRASGQ